MSVVLYVYHLRYIANEIHIVRNAQSYIVVARQCTNRNKITKLFACSKTSHIMEIREMKSFKIISIFRSAAVSRKIISFFY